MKLTENFTLEELIASPTATLKGINNSPDKSQIATLKRLCEEILQPIRNKFGRAIKITSGFRSERLNKAVRGASSSQHVNGEAADIVSEDNRALWNLICRMIKDGEIRVGQLIDEKNLRWIHISLPDSRHFNQILHL